MPHRFIYIICQTLHLPSSFSLSETLGNLASDFLLFEFEIKSMEYRTLEINLQSGKDLNKVTLVSKMDVYAVVLISGGDSNSKQKTKTPVDRDGDANPTWDFPMKFTVDESVLQQNRLTLDFKLICERAFGDKDIGEVHVPVKELLDSPAKGGADGKRFVSYQVRKPSGKPKGQLSFSYQFGAKIAAAAPHAAADPVAPPYGKSEGDPVMAYPAGPSSLYPPAPYPVAAAEGSGPYPPARAYPPANGTPQPGLGAYPPPHGYGYPPQASGYGYPPPPPSRGYGYPPQPGYGYPPPLVPKPPKKNNNKLGLGLGAGLLSGLLVGDILSDGGGFDCGGGFDF